MNLKRQLEARMQTLERLYADTRSEWRIDPLEFDLMSLPDGPKRFRSR